MFVYVVQRTKRDSRERQPSDQLAAIAGRWLNRRPERLRFDLPQRVRPVL